MSGTDSQNKTRPGSGDVDAFLAQVSEAQRADCEVLRAMMERVTGEEPVLWGPSIVGFGRYRYRYESGREGEWFLAGFSPRKRNLTLYIMSGFPRHEELMGKLGRHTTGKSCLYVKRLEDVDLEVLEELVRRSADYVKASSVEADHE